MAGQQKQNPRAKAAAAAKQLRYTIISRMAKALQHEFSLISNFKLGYRNKEDISTLPPYCLAIGSQNVLTNDADQIVIRNGYKLDGAASTQNTYGIDSAYDFNTHLNGIQNVRKWGPNLQIRYTNPVTKTTSWITIQSNLSPTNVCNFTSYWDATSSTQVCLFVNGDNNVHRWTGGVASFLSATSSTITVSGTQTLPQLNFDTGGQLLVDGVTYTYTNAGVSTSTPYTQNPTNAKILMTPTLQYVSQIFTTGAGASYITQVSAEINYASSSSIPVNFICSIYTDNAGVPGTVVGSASTGTASVGGAGDSPISFNFTQGVTPNTNYHIVFSTSASNNLVNFYIGASSGVGTNTSSNEIAWTPVNGYLYATVTESDIGSTTFSGVTPDPSIAGIAIGDAILQPPSVGVALTTGVPQPFYINIIDTFRNQVYYGSFNNNNVYISKVNSYADCSFSTPRVVGEGASVVLDAPPVAFIAQSDGEYMSAGRDFWYRTKFTLSADLSKESFEIDRLKTTTSQGAVAQSYVSKYKNSIAYVSYESIFNLLGPVKNILADPQVINISDSIKYDMDAYTFSGGSVWYTNYNIYFSVPKQGIVRVYNISKKYWEVPQTMPVGMFYEVSGQLYGHDATTDQSYELFVPNLYRDNETPINAIAAFPYVSSEGAQPNQLKFFNKHYTEGYIAGNTTLTLQFNYDFGAFSGTYSVGISGADKRIVFSKLTDGSLGTDTLGNQPIGTILNLPNQPPIPKFRIVNTFPPTNAYEVQTVFSTYALDANWAILRFGPAIGPARDTQAAIQE